MDGQCARLEVGPGLHTVVTRGGGASKWAAASREREVTLRLHSPLCLGPAGPHHPLRREGTQEGW